MGNNTIKILKQPQNADAVRIIQTPRQIDLRPDRRLLNGEQLAFPRIGQLDAQTRQQFPHGLFRREAALYVFLKVLTDYYLFLLPVFILLP
jgi:hypothetical protein